MRLALVVFFLSSGLANASAPSLILTTDRIAVQEAEFTFRMNMGDLTSSDTDQWTCAKRLYDANGLQLSKSDRTVSGPWSDAGVLVPSNLFDSHDGLVGGTNYSYGVSCDQIVGGTGQIYEVRQSFTTLAPPPIQDHILRCETRQTCEVAYSKYYDPFHLVIQTEILTGGVQTCKHVGDSTPKSCRVDSLSTPGDKSFWIPEGSTYLVEPAHTPRINYGPVLSLGQSTATLTATLQQINATPGSVNGVTDATFSYSTSASLVGGDSKTVQSCSGNCTAALKVNLSSLLCDTIYYYRAHLGGFDLQGELMQLRTLPCATLTNKTPVSIDKTSFQLTTSISNASGVTDANFLYGTDPTLTRPPLHIAPACQGNCTANLTATVGALTCGAKYFYRINLGGLNKQGVIGSFQVPACLPPVIFESLQLDAAGATALLNISLNSVDAVKMIYYSYNILGAPIGQPTPVCQKLPCLPNYLIPIKPLNCSTAYSYQVSAYEMDGTLILGDLKNFKTPPCQLPLPQVNPPANPPKKP